MLSLLFKKNYCRFLYEMTFCFLSAAREARRLLEGSRRCASFLILLGESLSFETNELIVGVFDDMILYHHAVKFENDLLSSYLSFLFLQRKLRRNRRISILSVKPKILHSSQGMSVSYASYNSSSLYGTSMFSLQQYKKNAT